MMELLICLRPTGSGWARGDVLAAKNGRGRWVDPKESATIAEAFRTAKRSPAEVERIQREGFDTFWGSQELREFAVVVADVESADVAPLLAMDTKGQRANTLAVGKLFPDGVLKDLDNREVLVKPDRDNPVSKAVLVAAIRKKS